MPDLLPPDEVLDLDYTGLRGACKAQLLSGRGSAAALRDRLIAYWDANTAEVVAEAAPELTALEAYASAVVEHLDVSRFDDRSKVVPFAGRAMRRTGGALVDGLSLADCCVLIADAYARKEA